MRHYETNSLTLLLCNAGSAVQVLIRANHYTTHISADSNYMNTLKMNKQQQHQRNYHL